MDIYGTAYLGDYGAATLCGDHLKELFVAYYHTDLSMTAKFDGDRYFLAVSALEVVGRWRPSYGPLSTTAILESIEIIDERLATFLKCVLNV